MIAGPLHREEGLVGTAAATIVRVRAFDRRREETDVTACLVN